MTTNTKIQSNYIGSFTKQDIVKFDRSIWSATNGTIDWSKYPKQIPYKEEDVYHTQLVHTKGGKGDVGWTIRIGKGGQIYSINVEGVGQITCPQRYMSPWNDDCMTTTVFSRDERNEDVEMGGNESFSNGYIHGSGMYIKTNMDLLNNKPFYNPILAEKFDKNDRSYSILNWGLVPKPNVNRGDVLFYSRYRDIGYGVLELTFYCYNFGDRVYNFAETPWWAFKPSIYPNMVEGIDGTLTFKINNKNFWDGAISSKAGWGAGTVDPNNPNSPTCALVWGTKTPMGVNFGFVDRNERDMMLIAPSYGALNMPFGTGFYYKRYAVFGKLSNVSNICASLMEHATLKNIEFDTQDNEIQNLYVKNITSNQKILTNEILGLPVAKIHTIPLKNSYPLILMKDKTNGQYVLSTDPYAVCTKKSFTNPYPIGHEKYEKYQNRVIYQPYDDKTEWVSLLGYVLEADTQKLNNGYTLLSNILGNVKFSSGEKLKANQLMILTP